MPGCFLARIQTNPPIENQPCGGGDDDTLSFYIIIRRCLLFLQYLTIPFPSGTFSFIFASGAGRGHPPTPRKRESCLGQGGKLKGVAAISWWWPSSCTVYAPSLVSFLLPQHLPALSFSRGRRWWYKFVLVLLLFIFILSNQYGYQRRCGEVLSFVFVSLFVRTFVCLYVSYNLPSPFLIFTHHNDGRLLLSCSMSSSRSSGKEKGKKRRL